MDSIDRSIRFGVNFWNDILVPQSDIWHHDRTQHHINIVRRKLINFFVQRVWVCGRENPQNSGVGNVIPYRAATAKIEHKFFVLLNISWSLLHPLLDQNCQCCACQYNITRPSELAVVNPQHLRVWSVVKFPFWKTESRFVLKYTQSRCGTHITMRTSIRRFQKSLTDFNINLIDCINFPCKSNNTYH